MEYEYGETLKVDFVGEGFDLYPEAIEKICAENIPGNFSGFSWHQMEYPPRYMIEIWLSPESKEKYLHLLEKYKGGFMSYRFFNYGLNKEMIGPKAPGEPFSESEDDADFQLIFDVNNLSYGKYVYDRLSSTLNNKGCAPSDHHPAQSEAEKS